jgi:hypothetical protein
LLSLEFDLQHHQNKRRRKKKLLWASEAHAYNPAYSWEAEIRRVKV